MFFLPLIVAILHLKHVFNLSCCGSFSKEKPVESHRDRQDGDARGWGGGGESVFNGTEFQFCKMEGVLEIDYISMNNLILLNCTLKNG